MKRIPLVTLLVVALGNAGGRLWIAFTKNRAY